jgi:hypothetical protein
MHSHVAARDLVRSFDGDMIETARSRDDPDQPVAAGCGVGEALCAGLERRFIGSSEGRGGTQQGCG